MSKPLSDQDARDRATGQVFTGMAVEAAAGAGKTSTMVDRIVNLVLAGVPIAEIAAITFTEKAAAELELRVRAKLFARRRELEAGPDRERVERALGEIDSAQISTIHSFALGLIRESPIEAGIDPRAEMMDELRSGLWFDDAWRRWLRSLSTSDLEVLARAVRFDLSLDHIATIAQRLAENRDIIAFLPSRGGAEQIFNALETQSRALAAEAADLLVESEKQVRERADKGYQATRAWAERASELTARYKGWDLLERFAAINEKIINIKDGAKGAWMSQAFHELRKEKMKAAREGLQQLQAAIRSVIADEVVAVLAKYVERADRERVRAGLLTFQDVLILARDLIKIHEEARRRFQRRWRWVLVDEVQDTDPLQVEIIEGLVEDDPQKLFLVGDPKQSIYRFRRADIGIYRAWLAKLEQRLGRATVNLSSNFRSAPGIIDWVNREFSGIIVDRGDAQAPYAAMAAVRDPIEGLPPVSALQPNDLEAVRAKVEAIRTLEAEAIAGLISRLIRAGVYQVYVEGKSVPLDYRHIAVLYAHRPDAEDWLAAFAARGIPCVSDLGRSFYSRDEAAMIGFAARAIDNPSDSLSIFAALRGPIFGFSDDELFAFDRAGGKFDYRAAPPPGFNDLGAALDLLARLHRDRNHRPIAATLEELLAATGARIACLTNRNGDQGLADISRVIAQSRLFERGVKGAFTDFVRDLSRIEKQDPRSVEPLSVDPDDNRVRLQTIHSAKGLEFPVVIVANLNYKVSRDKPALLVERLRGRAAVRFDKNFQTSGFNQLAALESDHSVEEAKRLLYVAATRARDALIWSISPPRPLEPVNPKGKDQKDVPTFIDLLPVSIARFQTERGVAVDGVFFWDHDPNHEDGAVLPDATNNLLPSDFPPGETEIDPTSFIERRQETLARAESAFVITTASQSKGVTSDESGPRSSRAAHGQGAQIGSLVHELMEELDLATLEPPRALIEAKLERAGLSSSFADVFHLLKNCLTSAPLRRAVASGRWFREVPYTVSRTDGVHEGRIDLVFSQGDRWVVVDYKTDRVPADAVLARLDGYAGQAQEYREAARLATGAEVEAWLVFCWPGVAVELKSK